MTRNSQVTYGAKDQLYQLVKNDSTGVALPVVLAKFPATKYKE